MVKHPAFNRKKADRYRQGLPLNNNMTSSKQSKDKNNNKLQEPYVSSRQWAEDCLATIKKMQDEFLDRYYTDKKDSVAILKLLTKLVEKLEKKL